LKTIFASNASLDLTALDGVERDADGVPTAFRIWRAGVNCTDKGDHAFTRESAAVLLAQQDVRGNLFSFDVDHMSLNQTSPIDARKAVGWHRLATRDDANGEPELWATDVQWTAAVRAGFMQSPPEWRYFSPAYSVDEANVITRYINTALTNNPATHNVTALAASAAADTSNDGAIMAKVDIDATLAALRATADGDDEKASKRARAALRAYFADDEEKETSEASDEEKKEASEASDEEKKEASEASDEEKKETSVAASVDLAKSLHETRTELAALKTKIERDALLASRPDFSAEIRATLAAAPLSVVKNAVKTWKRSAANQVEAALAATDTAVKATQGETQTDGTGSRLPAAEAHALDVKMGIVKETPVFGVEGTRQVLGTMTPDQAKAILASRTSKVTK
jgi:phage I-like protein